MQEVTRQSRIQRYLRDLAPWGIGVLIVVLAIGVVKQGLKRYSIQQEIQQLETDVVDLKTKHGELVDLLEYVKSPAYTEEQARLQFGFAKPGEHVAILPEGVVLGESVNAEGEQATETPDGNQWKWWYYFFPTKHQL